MTLPTQNAVPSSAKNDQLFNAEKIDQVVNSDDLQYTDRFGKKRFTLTGIYNFIQTWLAGLSAATGASGIGTADGSNVEDRLRFIDYYDLRISKLASAGSDVTSEINSGFSKSANNTLVIDVNCVVSSCTIPASATLIIAPGVTITQSPNSTGPMFILSDNSFIIGSGYTSVLDGNKDNQTSANYGVSASGVTGAGVSNVRITKTISAGAFFSSTVKTFFKNNFVEDVGIVATEYTTGQYVTNCRYHLSESNVITNPKNSGIKFRADSLGQTYGCRSLNDVISGAGLIGIANGKCQKHLISNASVDDCGDNGIDLNGCYDAKILGGQVWGCLDGAYMGENNITLCLIKGLTVNNCRRSGIGSMGALTNCTVDGCIVNGSGAGIYCSSLVGLKIVNNYFIGSVKNTYLDNESGTNKTSSGIGVEIQGLGNGVYLLDVIGNTFLNNAGYDLSFPDVLTVGSTKINSNSFGDSSGDGKVKYGAGAKSDVTFKDNFGFKSDVILKTTMVADGTKTILSVTLPNTVANTNYKISGVVPDWLTTFRVLDSTKTTTGFSIEFGSAPTSGTRNITFELSELVPV